MTDPQYSLVVASYDDQESAHTDFAAMKAEDDLRVVAAIVLSRDPDGKVTVHEHGGRIVAYGTGIGAVAGLVVGLFAAPLLASGVIVAGLTTALGAGLGAGLAEIEKRSEERDIGVDAEEWLPAGSSAIVAVVDDVYLDRVDRAFEGATRNVAKALDKGDYDAVVKAINKGDEKIVDAIVSS